MTDAAGEPRSITAVLSDIVRAYGWTVPVEGVNEGGVRFEFPLSGELLNASTASIQVMSQSLEKPVRLESREELEELVAERDRVLVDFYTEGCTLCQSIEPVLGNVARVADVTVAMLNPRESPGLIEEFDIRSVPTLVLFEGGEEVDRMADGFRGTDAVVEFVDA